MQARVSGRRVAGTVIAVLVALLVLLPSLTVASVAARPQTAMRAVVSTAMPGAGPIARPANRLPHQFWPGDRGQPLGVLADPMSPVSPLAVLVLGAGVLLALARPRLGLSLGRGPPVAKLRS